MSEVVKMERIQKYNFIKDFDPDFDFDQDIYKKNGVYIIIDKHQLISQNRKLLLNEHKKTNDIKLFEDDTYAIKFLLNNDKTIFKIKAGMSKNIYKRMKKDYMDGDGLRNYFPTVLCFIIKDNTDKFLLHQWEVIFRNKVTQNKKIGIKCENSNEKYMIKGRKNLDIVIGYGSDIADILFTKSISNIISTSDLYYKININDQPFDIAKKYGKINKGGDDLSFKDILDDIKMKLRNDYGLCLSRDAWAAHIKELVQWQKGICGNWPSYILSIRICEGEYKHDKDDIYN